MASTLPRKVFLSAGILVAVVGLTAFAYSFFISDHYVRGFRMARALATRFARTPAPLFYVGYETDVEELKIDLMNAGIWISFAGFILAGFATISPNRTPRRPPPPGLPATNRKESDS